MNAQVLLFTLASGAIGFLSSLVGAILTYLHRNHAASREVTMTVADGIRSFTVPVEQIRSSTPEELQKLIQPILRDD